MYSLLALASSQHIFIQAIPFLTSLERSFFSKINAEPLKQSLRAVVCLQMDISVQRCFPDIRSDGHVYRLAIRPDRKTTAFTVGLLCVYFLCPMLASFIWHRILMQLVLISQLTLPNNLSIVTVPCHRRRAVASAGSSCEKTCLNIGYCYATFYESSWELYFETPIIRVKV